MKTMLAVILIWLCISISRADERIMVEDAKVNGTPVKLAFDTGADDIYLFAPTVERLGLKAAPVRNLWRRRLERPRKNAPFNSGASLKNKE
jgi:hypothetical protein